MAGNQQTNDEHTPVCMIDDGGGQYHFEAASGVYLRDAGQKVVCEFLVPIDKDLRDALAAFEAVDALLDRGLLEHLLSQAFAAGYSAGKEHVVLEGSLQK